MAPSPVAQVKRLFDAVRRHDQARVLEAYDPAMVIHEAASLPYGGDYRGHPGALQHLIKFYQTMDPIRAMFDEEISSFHMRETLRGYVGRPLARRGGHARQWQKDHPL